MLKINIDKSAVIVFRTRLSGHQLSKIRLAEHQIERVQTWKYRCVILTENTSIVPDVDRASDAFLRQFNAVSNKIYYRSTEVLCFLLFTPASRLL